MNRGPVPGTINQADPLTRAQTAWGADIPDEVVTLAEACTSQSANSVAKRIGYSNAVVSTILGNKYRGDVAKVFAAIRGALMGETVLCPILDEIGRDRCLSEQKRPFEATNSTRARLYHACKRCEHRVQREVTDAS
ncbi:transcriptional regulator [Camelimonas lactis]|uniref:Transcriptional regulator n=1 Tax=Camelimonas lactis TaxID=659006 RepID=A0A4R2GR21_9HYPH|nr:transcriptional regulator [Camelimonas lactis]TCO12411.1 hypothetical protein EV666_10958 [Camelimonas lactis]